MLTWMVWEQASEKHKLFNLYPDVNREKIFLKKKYQNFFTSFFSIVKVQNKTMLPTFIMTKQNKPVM